MNNLDRMGQISLENLRRANEEVQLELTDGELRQMIQEVCKHIKNKLKFDLI